MDVLTVLKSQWDRIGAVVCVVAGVILLIVGYQGIADSPYVAEELAYLISGGLGGAFLLGIGATLYISADMHDEWRKLDRIEEAILSLRESGGAASPGEPGRFDDLIEPVAESRASRHRANSGAGANQTAAAAGVAQRSRQTEPRNGAGRPGNVLAMPRELLHQLRLGAAGIALAFVALMLAYWKAADTAESRPAFTATASAAAVLAIAGVLATIGMVGMRRRLMHRRNTLLTGFVLKAQSSARRAAPAADGAGHRMPERLLVIPEGRFAHVPGCAMVAGESTQSVSSAALPDGVLPCAICTPAAL
jgi:hypothetical protein